MEENSRKYDWVNTAEGMEDYVDIFREHRDEYKELDKIHYDNKTPQQRARFQELSEIKERNDESRRNWAHNRYLRNSCYWRRPLNYLIISYIGMQFIGPVFGAKYKPNIPQRKKILLGAIGLGVLSCFVRRKPFFYPEYKPLEK